MADENIPKDWYNIRGLKTVGGSAGAVWLVLMVIANLDHETDFIDVTIYKFISLGLSLALAFYLFKRDKRKKKIDHYLLSIMNGLLIFVNASGINTMTSQAAIKLQETASVQMMDENQTAGILFLSIFKNEVNWWKNPKEAKYYQSLKKNNAELLAENENLQNQTANYEKQLTHQKDSLQSVINNLLNEQSTASTVSQAAYNTLQQQSEALTNQINSLNEQLQAKTNEANSLLEQLEECRTDLQQASNNQGYSQAHVDGLQSQINALNSEKELMNQQLEDCRKQLEGITPSDECFTQADLDNLQKQIDGLTETNRRYKATIEVYQSLCQIPKSRLKKLVNEKLERKGGK